MEQKAQDYKHISFSGSDSRFQYSKPWIGTVLAVSFVLTPLNDGVLA